MTSGPKRLVSAGYDRIAETYLARYGASAVRDRWLAELAALLPARGGLACSTSAAAPGSR